MIHKASTQGKQTTCLSQMSESIRQMLGYGVYDSVADENVIKDRRALRVRQGIERNNIRQS
jgi:hypothetical protein